VVAGLTKDKRRLVHVPWEEFSTTCHSLSFLHSSTKQGLWPYLIFLF